MGRDGTKPLKQVNAALAQDPLSSPPQYHVLLLYTAARCGRLEEAEAAARRFLEINPTGRRARHPPGFVLLCPRPSSCGPYRILGRETIDAARLGGSAMAYFALGRKADSDSALPAKLLKGHAEQYAFRIAQVYGFRGEIQTRRSSGWIAPMRRRTVVGCPLPSKATRRLGRSREIRGTRRSCAR